MKRPSPRTSARIAVAALATGGLTAVGATAAAGDESKGSPTRPPWNRSCVVEIRAHDDGSASLSCRERSRPFAAVDAESGRIQFFNSR